MSPNGKKPKVELTEAELLLSEAKNYLGRGKSMKALKKNKKARESIQKTMDVFQRAMNAVSDARYALESAKKLNLPLKKAEACLEHAEDALANAQYEDVFLFVRRCLDEIKLAGIIPGRELGIKTAVFYAGGVATYEITIENNTEYFFRKLYVVPAFIGLPFITENERIISLPPRKECKVVFELRISPTDIALFSQEGVLIPGLDVTLETSLRPILSEGKIIYSVWLRNIKEEVLRRIFVKPFLPDGLKAEVDYKVIEELNPNETKGLIFEVKASAGE